MPSRSNHTPGRVAPPGRHRRRALTLSAALLALGALGFGAMPAFAEGERDVASEGTTETTAPPETTPPTEDPAPEDPPADDPPAQDPPAEDPPVVSQQQTQVSSLGDVGALGNESDSRAQYNSGNADNCGQAGITATHMLYGAGDNSNSDANVSGVVSAYTGEVPPGATPYADDADKLNVTHDASVVVKGIVVKGGNGWNLYSSAVPNMISPFNNGGRVPNISHWFVCYDLETPRQTGGLELTKTVVGPAPNTTFTVNVDCTDDAFDGTMIFDQDGDKVGGTLDNPITGIPVDTTCTITEPDDGGADSVQITGSPAVIAADVTSQVTVTNTFTEPGTGTVQVQKVTEGQVDDGTTFEVEVDCDTLTEPVPLSFTTPDDLGPKSVPDIPLPAECTVDEVSSQGATLVEYSANGGADTQTPPTVALSEEGDTLALVTVTNFFPSSTATGVISVEKAVDGSPPPGATYQVQVTCSDDTDTALTFGPDGGTKEVKGIKILEEGTECTVEETDNGGATQVSYSPQDTTFTLTLESPVRDLTVTNAFGDSQVLGAGAATGERNPDGVTVGTVGTVATGTLPFTGSTTAGLLKLAAWLLAIGSSLVLFASWRRRSAITPTA